MTWVIEYAAWVLTVRLRGQDGKTAYERIRGKLWSRIMACFGEVVLFNIPLKWPQHSEDGKLWPIWARGVFLGYDRGSNEYMLWTQKKIVKARTIQRVTAENRWNGEALQEVSASPYSLYTKPPVDVYFRKDPSVTVEAEKQKRHVKVRDMNLRKNDFEGPTGHGYTQQGCPRCKWAIDYGWEEETTLSHSKGCRGRVRKAIHDPGEAGKRRVEAAERRATQWISSEVRTNVQAEGETEDKGDQDVDQDMKEDQPLRFE
jgi:phage FluMu protein Com